MSFAIEQRDAILNETLATRSQQKSDGKMNATINGIEYTIGNINGKQCLLPESVYRAYMDACTKDQLPQFLKGCSVCSGSCRCQRKS